MVIALAVRILGIVLIGNQLLIWAEEPVGHAPSMQIVMLDMLVLSQGCKVFV